MKKYKRNTTEDELRNGFLIECSLDDPRAFVRFRDKWYRPDEEKMEARFQEMGGLEGLRELEAVDHIPEISYYELYKCS